jgi:hypothetical protein
MTQARIGGRWAGDPKVSHCEQRAQLKVLARQVLTAARLAVDDAQDGRDLRTAFPQRASGFDDLFGGGYDVLDDRQALFVDRAALRELACPVRYKDL